MAKHLGEIYYQETDTNTGLVFFNYIRLLIHVIGSKDYKTEDSKCTSKIFVCTDILIKISTDYTVSLDII